LLKKKKTAAGEEIGEEIPFFSLFSASPKIRESFCCVSKKKKNKQSRSKSDNIMISFRKYLILAHTSFTVAAYPSQ